MASQLTTAPAPTPTEWRAAMGYFPTGVTVVTTWRRGAPLGSTVSAFCSVSLEPPLLLICLDRSNPCCSPVAECGVFGVNILADDSGDLARRFAVAPELERFEGQPFGSLEGGAPQLHAAPIFIDCVVETTSLAGDHFIVVGRGVRIERTSAAQPLLYHAGRFLRFDSCG
ncbi:MAG: flavin reductase family protein [Phenylobacterium sp.]|jgi:3-hydroxy-9,10-secoandrosta-1,3,5(10)-triene-9,17-dione monooxygenase reductase component|uniref:flavin reductase family protein n=1 Tax=Phenylobacterium sp. TaxID=1871053 RepID=UPI002637667E|nr:flavin reductase family protein [Phenylobacterium sp.]MDB5427485.1 flavin reductase family protein [Phenylobacterium sp.]MDB5461818.1 flavin reductase family protein [Phenylobacterium sp.]MDB5496118.1 flavin reductase family protein [Phenylobacterium sp.]